MNRLLFLDFDGVLHPDGTAALDDNFKLIPNPQLFCYLPILTQLLDPHPEVRIIVSSDWRRLFDDNSLTKLLGPVGWRFCGVVEQYGPTRAAEVLGCAARRGISSWVAVDDHPSVVDTAKSDWRFVATPKERGLGDEAAQQKLKHALARLVNYLSVQS